MKILGVLLSLCLPALSQITLLGVSGNVPAPATAPTFVQGKLISGAASTNVSTVTLASNITAGHQVHVFGYACYNTSCTGTTGNINGVTITPSDTAGDTFTTASGAPIRSTTTNTTIFYSWLITSATGGNADIKLTCAGGVSGNCSYVTVWASEWTGVTAIDKFAASNHASANGTTGASQATAAGTANNEAVIGAITTGTNPAITPGSGFSEISEETTGVEHEYKSVTNGNGNTQTCTWNWASGSSSTSQTLCVTLK